MGTWKQASYWGILTGGNAADNDAAFNAGHLNDVLRLDEDPFPIILVAGETSGVWLVNQSGGVAVPLGDAWHLPNLNSLGRGVHGSRHVYAGGDALYETNVTQSAPLYAWREIPITGTNKQLIDVGGIIDIAAIQASNKLVLACGEGVFWADIPAAGGNYFFKQSTLPAGAYSGVAEGPKGTVVVAAWGSDNVNHFGLFYGHWTSGDLLFARSSLFGNVNDAMMLRTSIDSSPADRAVMYAVAGANYKDAKGNVVNDTIYRVFRSTNGGQSWTVTGNTVTNASDPLFGDPATDLPGNLQYWSNCIAASPLNPRLVALGWRNGYFFSDNAGGTWKFIIADSSPHLHSDLHAVAFDQFDSSQQTLYVCSDGGLATTRDLGSTHASLSNRQLPNLQLYRMAASPMVDGLLAGSLQDNGDEFCTLYPGSDPWHVIDGSDGQTVEFIENGRLIYRTSTLTWNNIEYGNRLRDARWNPSQATFQDVQEFPNPPLNRGVIPVDGTNDGLPFPITEIVAKPTWRNAQNELMTAVAGKDDKLYGLLLTSSSATHLTELATIPAEVDAHGNPIENITAVGSGNGGVIYVGTSKGRIFAFSAPGPGSQNWTRLELDPAANVNAITGFSVLADDSAFVIAAGQKLYKLTGSGWDAIAPPVGATGDYKSLATFGHADLFVATDNRVYSSQDEGTSWEDISFGLPETPHCRDLRLTTETDGARFLYLATYGRSVFRLLLNAKDDQNQRVVISGKMDMVDRVAFGHDIWAHPNFSNTAYVGPNHPIEDITIAEIDGDEVKVELSVHLQWFIDESVEVQHTAKLISMDEDNAVNDQQSGSFRLAQGASQNVVEDLVSDEFWPDRAHIEFTVTNA